jgi:uncharacterized protein (DUF1697 family)
MFIIIDHRIPEQAKQNLRKLGEVFELKSESIVYDAISSHPDIFIFQADKSTIIAKNSPKELVNFLNLNNIDFSFGNSNLSEKYPKTAFYNAAYRDNLIIHNKNISDSNILEICKNARFIDVKQAYSRCTTLILNKDRVITSDKGILKKLENAFLVDDSSIILPGFEHGFFGGCFGIFKKTIYVLGEINTIPNHKNLRTYIEDSGFNIVELNTGNLFDGGGIFFF